MIGTRTQVQKPAYFSYPYLLSARDTLRASQALAIAVLGRRKPLNAEPFDCVKEEET